MKNNSKRGPLSKEIILLSLTMGLLTLNCRTGSPILKDGNLTSFTPMAKVFNGQNRSCSGVLVTLTAEKGQTYRVYTDITGKALFPSIPFDKYQVTMSKENYEKVSFTFDYSRPDQVLYGRLYSFENLLAQCELQMEKQRWTQAQNWLLRADLLNRDESLVVFYRAIILWKTGFIQKAAGFLEAYKAEPLPAEMAQFLADIYKYDLREEPGDSTE